jgi:hypothetical protein
LLQVAEALYTQVQVQVVIEQPLDLVLLLELLLL